MQKVSILSERPRSSEYLTLPAILSLTFSKRSGDRLVPPARGVFPSPCASSPRGDRDPPRRGLGVQVRKYRVAMLPRTEDQTRMK